MKSLKLVKQEEFFIKPTSPFNFDATFHKPAHFPSALEIWKSGKFWQGIRIGEKLFGLKIEDKGDIDRPLIKINVYCNQKINKNTLVLIQKEIIWRYDLNFQSKEFDELCKKDKRFFPVFQKWRGMRNSCAYELYGLLVVGIVLQNATVRRTVQMMDALLKNYGVELVFDRQVIYWCWQPKDMEQVSEEELRALKIGYRAKFIKKLSQDFVEGKVDEFVLRKMPKEDIKKELTKLYGVGPETARILIAEAFHKYDEFDHIAPWQQKIYSMLFYNEPLVDAKIIKEDIIKRYGKYSMLAVSYIWEDIFWRRKNEHIEWLEKEIRL
ncbi:MAG: hypothetical protein M1355_00280 [Patescibacteria group bacterium]|nr:hypothetical protein [Patescibacteria group bacterium]